MGLYAGEHVAATEFVIGATFVALYGFNPVSYFSGIYTPSYLEATPVFDTVEGIDLEAYKYSLIEHFGNPNIKDSLARIYLGSSAKLPKFLISTIHENLASGGSIKYATLVIAAWCLYSDKGMSRHSEQLDIVDEMKDELHVAMGTENDPLSFLRLQSLYDDLAENKRFTALYSEIIEAIYENSDISIQMKKILTPFNTLA